MAETWNVDANGNWNTGSNWNPPDVPNATDASAVFGNVITAPRTVSVNVPITVGEIAIDAGNPSGTVNYTLAGPDALSLDNTSGPATVTVTNTNGNGSHTISADMSVIGGNDFNITQDSTGPLTFSGALDFDFMNKDGAGTLILSGSSSNTGGLALQINAGTVVLDKTAATAITDVIVGSGGTLEFSASDQILNTGTITVNAGGTAEFNGESDTINSALVSGVNAVMNLSGGSLSVNRNVVGPGSALAVVNGAAINGPGTILMTGGLAPLTGGVGTGSTMSCDLDVGPFQRTFSIATGSATDNMVISGSITNATGGIVLTQTGRLVLTGTNTFGGGTTISGGGTLALSGSGSLSPTGAMTVNSGTFDISLITSSATTIGTLGGSGGTVQLGSKVLVTGTGASTSYAGVIAGVGGSLAKLNAGTLTLTGINTYTGQTTVGGGTLALSGSGTFPSSNAVAVNGGSFDISAITPGAFTFGNLSGTGGTVAIGSKTLSIGTSSNTTYAGAITGTGSLVKQGSGNLTLSGAGNNISGTTTVSAGRLNVNGALTSGAGLSVDSGATLGGTGTITANTTINGMLSPGNSIGTITLVGDQLFTSGSTLEIEINPISADRVNITGALTIQPGATLLVIPEPGVYPASSSYLIVDTTAGVTGRFSSVVFSLPTFQGTLEYTVDDILIVLASLIPFSDMIPCGTNASKVAACLDNLVAAPGSDLETVLAQLRFIPTTEQLTDSLNEIQPSQFTALALAQESSTLNARETLFHRMDQLTKPCDRRGTLPEKRASIWVTPYFGINRQGRHHEEPGFRTLTGDTLVGIDYALTSIATLGIGGGYSFNHLKWKEDRGHARMQNGYGSLYGNFTGKRTYLSTAFVGGYSHYSTTRNIEFPDDSITLIDRKAKGSHNGYQVSAHAKGGLLFGSCFQFSPFLAGDYLYIHENSFTEHGAQSLNLHVHTKNSDLLQGEGGIQMFGCFSERCSKFSPSLSLSVIRQARMLGKKVQANLKHTDCVFSVNGMNPSRTLFHGEAGFTVLMPNENNTLSLNYEGMFGKRYQDNSVFAEYIFRF